MKLDQQVTSLELSKRLKELGVVQESLFYWVCNENDYVDYFELCQFKSKRASAFTVMELGELLPEEYSTIRYGGKYRGGKYGTVFMSEWDFIQEDTEADARAKCLIYLLENGLIKQ